MNAKSPFFSGLVALMLATACASLPKPDLSPPQANLKILTYNVNWGMAHPERVVDFLRGCGADVICLQETQRDREARLRADAELSHEYPLE